MHRIRGMPFKEFWDAVAAHLSEGSAGDLRRILEAMARRVPRGERRSFLTMLDPDQGRAGETGDALDPDTLLADIRSLGTDFREAVENAEPPSGPTYDWEYRYEIEEDDGGYEEFAGPISDLFDRAEAAFDYGNREAARTAYEELFELLDIEDDYGMGITSLDLPEVDLSGARARYLRAVLETEPPADRVPALYREMMRASGRTPFDRPRLEDLLRVGRDPLPDQESFLEEWIGFLQDQTGKAAAAWLREGVHLLKGSDGLAGLARSRGDVDPRIYLDWVVALEAEGEHQKVVDTAALALGRLPAELPLRAEIADILCGAALELGDSESYQAGRWEAFAARPELDRLLDLWESVGDLQDRASRMRQAGRHLTDRLEEDDRTDREERHVVEYDHGWRPGDDVLTPITPVRRLLAHALLLSGALEEAMHLGAEDQELGWSSVENAQGLVVPVFLVLLSDRLSGPLSPNLAALWEWTIEVDAPYWMSADEEGPALAGRIEAAYKERLTALSVPESLREGLTAWCVDVVRERVAAIVGEKHRGAYERAAVLTVACAEMLWELGAKDRAEAVVQQVRERFPRHRAFQADLRTALGQSPILQR